MFQIIERKKIESYEKLLLDDKYDSIYENHKIEKEYMHKIINIEKNKSFYYLREAATFFIFNDIHNIAGYSFPLSENTAKKIMEITGYDLKRLKTDNTQYSTFHMEFELDKIVHEYEYKIKRANIIKEYGTYDNYLEDCKKKRIEKYENRQKKYFENEHLYEQSPLKNTKGTCVIDSIAILFFDNNREKSIEWCRKEFSKINKEGASKKSFYSSHFAEIAQMFVDMGYLKEIEGYAKMKVIKAVDKLPGEYLVEVRRHVFCIRNHKIIENMQLSHVCYIKKIYEKIADIREF